MKDFYYSKYEPIFGSWHITEEIGSGAEGHLYRIRREDALGHVFYSALKAITVPSEGSAELESMIASGMSNEDAEHYFESILDSAAGELALLEKLKGNSNIVSYEDHEIFRHEEGIGWDILMRMEELTPLVKYSIYHPMDEAEIIKLGKDICRGLSVCCRFGIVHRDIKPENIFVSTAGYYKLGDFGIARIMDSTTASMSRKGTYSYMAPEIYWGNEYDYTVDLYSLGLVMYRYMNDGRLPLMPNYPDPIEYRDGETAFAERVGGHKLPEPHNGSPELKRIILKACAYDKADRYSSAEEMLADLEALEQNQDADQPGSGTTAAKSPTKRAGERLIAAVLAVLLIGAAAVYAMIPKEVEDIEISGAEDGKELYLGEEVTPEYRVQPDWFKNEPITFQTSDPDILAVNENGQLNAVSLGDAIVSMKAKDYTEEYTIHVVPKIKEIKGIETTYTLTTGEEVKLEPELLPEQFASEPVTYTSSDDKTLTVSKDGVVKSLAAGTAVVTIYSGGTSITTEITVSDPVVYVAPKTTSSKKTTKSSNKSSKSGSSVTGYFNSSDDEHF